MTNRLGARRRQYAATLARYLACQEEATLQQAYELGRKAIAAGLGVLDMARLHQEAMALCFPTESQPQTRTSRLNDAETFLMEALSPFEAAHRGFREANLKLHHLNAALGRQNAELGAMNRELASEVSQRKRTERALRQSEEHYRQLFQQARLMQEHLRNLSSRVLHVQEEERKRISRELHDEVGQALTAVSTSLAMLHKNGASDGQGSKQKLGDAQGLLAQTMETVHRFAREMRPAMLDELGLLPALRSYLKSYAQRTGLRVHFTASAEAESLNEEQKTVVFRVAQESLTNVAKHARASQVIIGLRRLREAVRIQIKDNGRAFQVEQKLAAKGKERLGLLGMQERVRLVNGRLTISSRPGRGTTVGVEIPLSTFTAGPRSRSLARRTPRPRRSRGPLYHYALK